MSLPGFSADESLRRSVEPYSLSGAGARNRPAVRLQQRASLRAPDSREPASAEHCFHADHVPVCYSAHPAAAFGRCCDRTHEVFCGGRRVSICTFTDCTRFPDTNAPV
jgi:hypothetical protein